MLGGGGDEVSVMPIVYPHGTVSVSSLVFFGLLIHHLNLLVLSLLSLSYYTIFKIISRRRGGGGAKTHKATGGEGQARAADEANEGDSQIKVGCYLFGFVTHGISSL